MLYAKLLFAVVKSKVTIQKQILLEEANPEKPRMFLLTAFKWLPHVCVELVMHFNQ